MAVVAVGSSIRDRSGVEEPDQGWPRDADELGGFFGCGSWVSPASISATAVGNASVTSVASDGQHHRSKRCEEFAEAYDQPMSPVARGIPDQTIVDRCVRVDQHVPECDEPSKVGDLRSQYGVGLAQLVEGFANDLELSFD